MCTFILTFSCIIEQPVLTTYGERYDSIFGYVVVDITITGVVTEINYTYRRLKVIRYSIAFEDIYYIKALGIG